MHSLFFRKSSRTAPPDYFAWEGAGLRWIAESGAAVVPVIAVGGDYIELERLIPAPPSKPAAEDFGVGLAELHRLETSAYGVPPRGWNGDGYFGPTSHPLRMLLRPVGNWGEFYANQRVAPMADALIDAGAWGAAERAVAARLMDRLTGGDFDTGEGACRIHGDLWSGNLVWTSEQATMVDPAAHGAHRETDIAMLHLFGAPYLEDIVGGYEDSFPLADGWRDRLALHQVYPLLVHALIFGGGYVAEALRIMQRYA